MEYDVVVIGTYFFDEIYVGLPQFPEPGREIYCQDLIVTPGAAYITVAALARLGVKGGWISCFGNDHYSRYIFERGQQDGLDMSLARRINRPHRQVTTSLPYNGERAFITVSDPEPDDMVDYIITTLADTHFKHVHFAWLPDAAYRPVFELARQKGAGISADCQDIALLNTPDAARQIIEQLDIFLPNAREISTLTGAATIQDGIQQVAGWVNLLVVKDGANGVWIAHQGDIQQVPAMQVDTVIDTTGAGDCFNAGFLTGYLIKKHALYRSATYGNICAGHSVMGVGGTANLLDFNAMQQAASQTYSDHLLDT